MAREGYVSEVFVSFQGEGAYAGQCHLFVRLAGCNLRCRYCDTAQARDFPSRFPVRDFDEKIRHLRNPVRAQHLALHLRRTCGVVPLVQGLAITGGEPLTQVDFLAALLQQDGVPRPRLLETNGTLAQELARVLPLVDAVSMDIKLPSNTGEAPQWEAHAAFLRVARGKVYVKIPIDDDTRVREFETAVKLVETCDPPPPVFLQPINRRGCGIAARPHTIRSLFKLARRHLREVRVLPQVHTVLGLA